MHISELKINNYGKFNEKKIQLTPGINIIYGENESGKSTLFSFIKSMMFGIERQRGIASKNDEYSQYEPWVNRTYYEGKLRFFAGGRRFRIERGFNKANRYAYLFNEDDGEELDLDKGDLNNILDGMSENIFLSANAIPQTGNRGLDGLKSEFRNYTSNCGNLYDNPINIDMAIDSLKSTKKEYENQLREQKANKAKAIAKLEGELKFLNEDISRKQRQIRENDIGVTHRKKDIIKEAEAESIVKIKDVIIFVVVLLSAILAGYLSKKAWLTVVITVIICGVKTIYNIVCKKKKVSHIDKVYDDDKELQYLQGAKKQAMEDLQERIIEVDNINDEINKMNQISDKEQGIEKEIKSIEFAIEKIRESVELIQKDTANILNRNVSEIYSKITSRKYTDVNVDTEFNSMLNTPDKLINSNRISKGAKDELEFAIRLSVVNMFFEDEKMPIIIDDMFAMYDDRRLAATLDILANLGTQVIIFTCHKREREILKSKHIIHNYIELTV